MKMIAIKDNARTRSFGFTVGRIVTPLGSKVCPKCGLIFHIIEEIRFGVPPLGSIYVTVCECGAEFGETREDFFVCLSSWLAPIDDQETRDAFEKLEKLDRTKEKQKGRVKTG